MFKKGACFSLSDAQW